MGAVRTGQGPAGLECCCHRCCGIWAVTVAPVHRKDHNSLIKTDFGLVFNQKTIYASQEETFLPK